MASNYPNGIKDLVLRGTPITQLHPGVVYFVNSTSVFAKGGIAGSNNNPGTYQRPYATIDYAIGQCVANRGDIIVVMPGHTETISAAAGVAQDVAGVAVIGLGDGSLRPTINYTATASTWTRSPRPSASSRSKSAPRSRCSRRT